MANKKIKPLLSLSTERFIACIEIDGKEYGLLSSEELTPRQQFEMSEGGRVLSENHDMTKAGNEERCNKSLFKMLSLIMPGADKSLVSKLSITKRLKIVNAYMPASGMIKKKVTRLEKGPKAKKKKR